MAITEATIKLVKFPPELIPDSWFGNVPLNGEVTPPVLELRRFSPYLVRLVNIQLTLSALVELRARYDDKRVAENAAAALTLFPNAWQLPAKDTMFFNFFGVGFFGNYPTHYGLWVQYPTVAHKLLFGMKLNAKEQAINQELGISDTVEKGLLPLPIDQLIQREYHVMGEETHMRTINIAAANTVYAIENLYPRPGEFIVLTRIAALSGVPGDVVRFHVDRDNDVDFANVQAFPLSLVPGGEISCFVPAMTEIRLSTDAVAIAGPIPFRYTFQRIKLTNILRVRFGLMSEAEAPADLYKKVLAGVV